MVFQLLEWNILVVNDTLLGNPSKDTFCALWGLGVCVKTKQNVKCVFICVENMFTCWAGFGSLRWCLMILFYVWLCVLWRVAVGKQSHYSHIFMVETYWLGSCHTTWNLWKSSFCSLKSASNFWKQFIL